MSQVDGLSEASAVHFRIEYQQEQRDDSEDALHHERCCSESFPPYAAYQGCSDESLRKCQCNAEYFGCRGQETDVHEVEVLFDYQAGSDRIHKFYQSGKEENHSEQESAETLYSKEERIHVLLDYGVYHCL